MNHEYSTHQGADGQTVTMSRSVQAAPQSASRVTVGNIQGVTRYTAGQAPEEAPRGSLQGSSNSSGGVSQGVIRFSAGQGAQEAPQGVTRQTAADLAPVNGGILATARNNAGFTTGNITPNCTVELPGMGRTSVKVAETLGYISRTPDGRYIAAGGAPLGKPEGDASQSNLESAPQEQQQQQPEGQPDLWAPDDEAAYATMIEPIPQGTYDSMMAGAASMLGQGQDMDSIVAALTARHGSDIIAAYGEAYGRNTADEGSAEAARNLIATGAEGWQKQADDFLGKQGVEASDFYEWARENRPEDLMKAVQGQFFGRSLKGYSDLVSAYYDNVPPTLEALTAGGVPHKTQGGTVHVKLGGMWMTLDSAVKARMV